MTRSRGGDETWFRLINWTKDQKSSERLAVHIVRTEGYVSLDPSHPLGGKDGNKDALAVRNNISWIIAAYFPRGQQKIKDIKDKFQADLRGVKQNKATGIVFVTNQELRLGERAEIKKIAGNVELDLFHLERVASLLDSPQCYGFRLEFLDIEMTKEEQLAFFAWVQAENNRSIQTEMRENLERITGFMTGGNSFCYLMISSLQPTANVGILTFVHHGLFPLYNVAARIVDLKKMDEVFLTKNVPSRQEIQFAETNINIGDLTPNHAIMGCRWVMENPIRNRYNIFFTARNGSFTQLLRLAKVDDRWVVANRVMRETEILFEKIDKNYPLNDSGEVDW